MDKVYTSEPNEFIQKCAEELKKLSSVKAPSWSKFVKTGASKERPPVDSEWWYIRAASILRKIYMRGATGVSKLRTIYGSKKNRGVKPEHFYKAAGSHIRKILQQLEAEGLLEKVENGTHKGRIVSPAGKAFLSKVAFSLKKDASSEKSVKSPKNENAGSKKVEHKRKTEKSAKKTEEKAANKEKAVKKSAVKK